MAAGRNAIAALKVNLVVRARVRCEVRWARRQTIPERSEEYDAFIQERD
jgi:hypothetical protein